MRLAMAAAAGVLYFLGFAGFDLWPLSFVALVPVLWALDPLGEKQPLSRRQLVSIGLLFGFVVNVGGYYWLTGMLERFSGFPFFLCVLFASVVWIYQGCTLLIFAVLYRKARLWGAGNVIAASCAMCLAEWLFPMLFTHYFGNSLHLLPIAIQAADLGGPLLVTFLLTASSAGFYALLISLRSRKAQRVDLTLASILWVLNLGYGAYRIAEVDARSAQAKQLRVGIVQVNMGLFEKRQDPLEGLKRHVQQSYDLEKRKKLDLLVWPESAYGWYIPETTTNLKEYVFGNVLKTPILFGGLAQRTVNGEKLPFNTAFLADANGELLGTYDKTYLLAFGEYIPFGDMFPILYEWSPNSSHFGRGDHVRPLKLGDYRISTLICYEDILPNFVRSAIREGNPHLLVNLTNDAWFGDTHEPWEHLALAKFRSVEHHRALVRSTNSGVSTVIDPVGRVVTQSGTFTRETLDASVPMLTGSTLYGWVGDSAGILSALWLAFLWRRSLRAAV